MAALAVRFRLEVGGNEQGEGEEQNLDTNTDKRKPRRGKTDDRNMNKPTETK